MTPAGHAYMDKANRGFKALRKSYKHISKSYSVDVIYERCMRLGVETKAYDIWETELWDFAISYRNWQHQFQTVALLQQ